MTPCYALVILFYASVFYKTGSGPLWDSFIGVERDACRDYWWTNLLYINNYVPTDTLVRGPFPKSFAPRPSSTR